MDILKEAPPVSTNAVLNRGDVVYFKMAKKTPTALAAEIKFKQGHGFGLLLGMLPSAQEEPKANALLALMGAAGWVSFDDVAEFLGKEQMEALIKKFEDKYLPKVEIIKKPEGA